MSKRPQNSYISFKVQGMTKVFELPEHGRNIHWNEIRDLIFEELLRQYARGSARIDIRHYCAKCKTESILAEVTVNKPALIRLLTGKMHIVGDDAAEIVEEFCALQANTAMYAVRIHFYPPHIFQMFGKVLLDIRKARFAPEN